MKRQCAWCGQSIGQPILGVGEKISHGICPRCSQEMISLLDSEAENSSRQREGNLGPTSARGASMTGHARLA
jgi:hypothetical protein